MGQSGKKLVYLKIWPGEKVWLRISDVMSYGNGSKLAHSKFSNKCDIFGSIVVWSLQKMPLRCAGYGCSNTLHAANQIALHPITYGHSRPEAIRRRRRWVEFVKQRWEPTKSSRVYSKHFKPEDFTRILNVPGIKEHTFLRLKIDLSKR